MRFNTKSRRKLILNCGDEGVCVCGDEGVRRNMANINGTVLHQTGLHCEITVHC